MRQGVLPCPHYPPEQALLVHWRSTSYHPPSSAPAEGDSTTSYSPARLPFRPLLHGHRWCPFHHFGRNRLLPACHWQRQVSLLVYGSLPFLIHHQWDLPQKNSFILFQQLIRRSHQVAYMLSFHVQWEWRAYIQKLSIAAHLRNTTLILILHTAPPTPSLT